MTTILGVATALPEDRQDWSVAFSFVFAPDFLDDKSGTVRVARETVADNLCGLLRSGGVADRDARSEDFCGFTSISNASRRFWSLLGASAARQTERNVAHDR